MIPDDLAAVDYVRYPIQIAERVWWVGHVQENDPFQCHVYLIEQGKDSVLIDPGSRLTFQHTLHKIEEVIPFTHLRYFICHHQDPDITAALPIIDQLISRRDAVLVTHWRARALIRHYRLQLPFWLIDQHEWELALEDRKLSFIFTPYAHFPGAFCTFDNRTGVLFSSDLFGGYTDEFALIAKDEQYFEAMRPFHEHYMPSRDILNYALSKIQQYPVRLIAPQHGSIIPPHLVEPLIDKLKTLECGIYMMAQESTDIQRLVRLNQALRDMLQTMMISRDFEEIATGLLAIIQRLLPAVALEFYANCEDGALLHLAPATRYRGRVVQPPPVVADIIGKTQAEWLQRYGAGYQQLLLPDAAGQPQPALLLPLVLPAQGVIHALAVIQLLGDIQLLGEVRQLIDQAVLPLQVAVEREVIYRTLDLERQRYYERSIRDPLTDLYSRFYMQDVVQRLLSSHDRDANATVAVAMIDIDYFKKINDTLGHPQGDKVLCRIAQVLNRNLRSSDLPVRLGGEEFAVFIVGQSPENACRVAERIRRQVAALRFAAAMEDRRVTVSIGIALRRQQESLPDFMQRADRALYQAKANGRNQVKLAG